jgi:surfactin synthase thioesterase subunit
VAIDVDDPWLRCFVPAPGAAVRLVCFPHAGGAASWYVPMARAMAPGCEVVAVQYPGRQDRREHPLPTSVTELADGVVLSVLACADRPLALFGHSLGASVAFEVAQRLEQRGVALVALFASARTAPSRWRAGTMHTLPDEELLAAVMALGGTDAAVSADPELRAMVLPALCADYRCAEIYRPSPPGLINAPIHVLLGAEDPQVDFDEARDWARHTRSDSTQRVFPGGHFYLVEQSEAVLDEIRYRVGRAEVQRR